MRVPVIGPEQLGIIPVSNPEADDPLVRSISSKYYFCEGESAPGSVRFGNSKGLAHCCENESDSGFVELIGRGLGCTYKHQMECRGC